MSMLAEPATASEHIDKRSRRREWVALIAGTAIFLAVISPPADTIVDQAFSAHMLQHMILIDLVAPLLAIAWPLLLRRWSDARPVRALSALARPVPALVLSGSTAALWFWHIPQVYDAALANAIVHALEHLVFVGAFVLFWRPLIDDALNRSRLRSNETRVLYLTAGMLANGLLAAYITFAGHLIYPHYAQEPSGGRTPLADQHLGGAVMWLVGTVAVVVAALATLREDG